MDQRYTHNSYRASPRTSSTRRSTTQQELLPPRSLSQIYKDHNDHDLHVPHCDLTIFNPRHSFHLPFTTTTHHHRLSSVSSTDTFSRTFRSTSFHSTPTPSSHSGLLQKPPPPPPPAPPSVPRRRFPLLCPCPCSGTKSVNVEENLSQPRFLPQPQPRFSFPLPEPTRHSVELDVFNPSRIGYAFHGSPLDDDVGSDASSDLFEIESFSKRRDSVDSSAACRLAQLRRSVELAAAAAAAATAAAAEPPREGYAPSEASVEWSVTTAEGFDRPGSNFEPVRTSGKRRGSGLLACVCEKAVSVGPDPLRFGSDKAGRVEMDRVREIARLVRSNSARICRPLGSRLG